MVSTVSSGQADHTGHTARRQEVVSTVSSGQADHTGHTARRQEVVSTVSSGQADHKGTQQGDKKWSVQSAVVRLTTRAYSKETRTAIRLRQLAFKLKT